MTTPKLNGLAELFARTGTRYLKVTHPLFGTYRLRSLTTEEAFRLRLSLWSVETAEKSRLAKLEFDRELLALSLVNESGTQILDYSEAERLDGVDASLTSWLLHECRAFSGVDAEIGEVLREVEGN